MVLLLEISTPCKVQAEWPRMDVIVLTLVLNRLYEFVYGIVFMMLGII